VGETASALRPSRLTVYSSGQYDVVVRNTVGSVEVSRVVSRKATVQVAVSAAASGTLVESLTANEGENVAFSSYAFTGQTTSWVLENGTLASQRTSGQGTSVLSLRNVTAADAGVYTATVSGGSASSVVRWLLQVVPVPVITAQPVPLVGTLAVNPKTDAVLSAGVTTTSDTRYQWYFQASPDDQPNAVPGAVSNTLRIKGVSADDSGYYSLEVSNPAGTVVSDLTEVHVLEAVTVAAGVYAGGSVSGGSLVSGTLSSGVISGATVDGGILASTANVDPGSTVTFGATTSGDLIDSGDKAFQWYRLSSSKIWTVIPKAVQSTLTLTGVAQSNETLYRVRAFGATGGAVDSSPVKLTVNDPVTFTGTLKLQTVSISQGESATLAVAVSGYQPQYEWFFNGTLKASGTSSSISGGTLLTYSIPNAQPSSSGTYSITIRNGFTPPISGNVAAVTVKEAPAFADAPGSATPKVKIGDPATTDATGVIRADEGQAFTLTTLPAPGCVPFTYQWRRNGVAFVSSGRVVKGSVSVASTPVELTFTGGVTAADAGQYDVIITNQWGSVISNPVNVVVALKPSIVTQPKAVTATKNGSANFTVEAVGEAPLSYAWYFGDALVGTSKLLSINNVDLVNAGLYRVQISNRLSGGTATISTAAQLTVTRPGDFTVSVAATLGSVAATSPVTAGPGSSFRMNASVLVNGTLSGGSYTFQWRKDGISIDGANAAIFSVASLGNTSGGAYDVVVSDGANFAYSSPVTLVMDPLIESLEIPSLVNPGDGVEMQVKVTSSKPLRYQWFKGTAAISGATADVYTILSAAATDAGTYSVVVTATGGGTAVSQSQVMSVSGKVRILTQPTAQTVVAGSPLALSVAAENAATYQWYRTLLNGVRAPLANGNGISGATSRMLGISSAVVNDAGVYQVEVGNTAGSVLSVPVSVTVNGQLSVSVTTPPQAAVGSGVNLIATAVGTGTIQYAWYFTANGGQPVLIEGETTEQLQINPVALVDAGVYTVEVSNGNGTASASVTLEVLNVPEILVAPASQSIVAGGTVRFAVVAKFDKPLTYTWYRGTGADRVQVLTGDRATASQLTRSNVTGSAFATYTVRVADSTNAGAAVEVSATLSERTPQSTTTESLATDYTKWWVYWVEGVADNPANNRYGYWISERLLNQTSGAVTAGRSAWVWSDESGNVTTDTWLADTQQVQEAAENIRSEFSVIANRTAGANFDTFVISGRVETDGEAAVYGAPDQIEGEYKEGTLLELDLSWDIEMTLEAGDAETLDEVVEILSSALQAASEAPAGD
jgi:hypothetical protein